MSERIPPSSRTLAEALALSDEILHNLELSTIPLTNIALKTSRLARLLNEFDMQATMVYEAGGYPLEDGGVPQEAWRLGATAGRKFDGLDPLSRKPAEFIYTSSIEQLEVEVQSAESALAAARDPDASLSSSNVYQHITPISNRDERKALRNSRNVAAGRLSSRRAFIHRYVSEKHYELKLSGIAEDIFSRIRGRVDAGIGRVVPDAVKRLSSAYENLRSDNPEDWSNAVHSCRRILEDLADAVFPATEDVRSKEINGKTIQIKLGKPNYKNRLLAFVDDRAGSKRYEDIVGSHLDFLGDRLDAVFTATQKGSHTTISHEEADRYVVYTYLLVGDILSLG